MQSFKEFIVALREIELAESFILIPLNITSTVYEYLLDLKNIEIKESEYHKYCGQLKVTITRFINYWTDIIDETVKIADEIRNTTDKKKLITLLENTIEFQNSKQKKFCEQYLPFITKEEEIVYQRIENMYQSRIKDLNALILKAPSCDTQEKLYQFLDEQLNNSIKKRNEMFLLAHTNISLHLLKNVGKIRISLEEILLRLRNNWKKLVEDQEDRLEDLMAILYDANKIHRSACRLEFHRNSKVAEVEWQIQKIVNRIKTHKPEHTHYLLEEDVTYWESRLAEFTEIEQAILKLQEQKLSVTHYLKQHEAVACNETAVKDDCWSDVAPVFKERIKFYDDALLETARALVTFFAIQGRDRILYKDDVGRYMVDDFGHKVYSFDNGRKECHVRCDGSYVEYPDDQKYYYDRYGKYTIGEDGERVYQWDSCTSKYKLTDDELFVNITKDCGHSEKHNRDCKMQLRDCGEIEILPKADPVDIKATLMPEIAKYLWDICGHILPDALNDVAIKQPLNPIYYLAHRIFHYKYRKNNLQQIEKKKVEAAKFRANVYNRRHEKNIAENKAWKLKQVKKRKPEESDDADTRAVMAVHEAEAQAIQQGYMNDLA